MYQQLAIVQLCVMPQYLKVFSLTKVCFFSFQLLPENIGDPLELLTYLGPQESGSGGGTNSNSNDDLFNLSLFDS